MHAAPSEEELKALRGRIDRLTEDLHKKESSQREVRDGLRDSERAISAANRALARAAAETRKVRAEAAAIAQQRAALERAAAAREASIEHMLAAQAAARTAGGDAPQVVRVALSGADPADLGRTLYYLGYVSRAAAALLADQRSALAELERLAGEARARAERLRAIEQASRADRDRIVAERAERRRVFASVGAEVRRNRGEIKTLRADEARLASLLEALRRMEIRSAAGAFSSLRGKLPAPVRGEPTPRLKGLFIRAPQGQPVRAVARGQVVYADWMRGFGNLMIIDHGESYLSIYANAEALLKEPGDIVAPGETIATTGSSGGNEETGLYFEMRHLGRAFDPLRWVGSK